MSEHALEDLHRNIAVIRHPDHRCAHRSYSITLQAELLNASQTKPIPLCQRGRACLLLVTSREGHLMSIVVGCRLTNSRPQIVVIDSAIACIGGLDLCYGRWDTHNFSMADVHPDNLRATALPGQDFSDARVQDFENVQAWAGNQQARTDIPRLGWHDLHCMLIGPAVVDVAQHFIERLVPV